MRKLQDYLDAGATLGRLSHRAQRLAELESAYAEAAPDRLAEASGVSHLEAGTLFLCAENGAVAAKLRQLAPLLLSKLRKQAPECTAIRVTVQVRGWPARRPSSARRRLGEQGIVALQALAETLPPSPLKAAVARLAARGYRRSEDGE